MRRRAFIVFAGAALVFPALAAAPPGRSFRIGFIAIADSFTQKSPNRFAWLALESELSKLGYREGDNLVIARRHGSGNPSGLKDAASALVQLNPQVIAAFGSQNVAAARQASATVPIVSYTDDLVALGFASSYAKPGGNVTGVSPSTSAVTLKQFELLVALVPAVQRVAWLRNPANPIFSASFGEEIDKAGAAFGVTASRFDAGSADALEATIGEIARQRFDAVLVPADVSFVQHRARLAALLLQHGLASASLDKVMLDAGLLLTYGVDVLDGIRRMASQIDKVLHGTPAGDIPIEFIDRFHLGINARTAKALGLTISQSILLRADRVID